jgi:oxygen-dependent protoporphyrinogen oxidase
VPAIRVTPPRVRIVGAGLSGLAAAWCLTDRGCRVEIADASPNAGGLIQTKKTGDGLIECAANAFLWTDVTERWFRALGIRPVFPRPESRRRYIFRNGRPRRWPLAPTETLIAGSRGALHWIRGTARASSSESVAEWSDRVLSRAATTWLVSPALQGVYGVPADRLLASVTTHRPRRPRTLGPRMAAPIGGMGDVVRMMVSGLVARGATITLGTAVSSLDPATPTIVCTDAASAAALVEPHAPELGAALRGVRLNPVQSITAFFEPHRNDLSGFGVLFPRPEGVEALGMLANAHIFPGRGPWRSETWIYGGDAGTSRASALGRLLRDRERLTGRRDEPRVMEIGGPAFLPVYGPPVQAVRSAMSLAPPWLGLAGNYLGEIGVAGLLSGAEMAVRRLLATSREKPVSMA